VERGIASFENRPLNQQSLKGDQQMSFFSDAVPNGEGWRNATNWKSLYLSDKWKQHYLDKLNQQFSQTGKSRQADISHLKAITDAFAALRTETKSAAGGYTLPPKKGENYSSDLAEKQVENFSFDTDVIDAYLTRDSWKVFQNALGVPLRRTIPGVVFYEVEGQELCQLQHFTLTEPHIGGGNYGEAAEVKLGHVRFQKCS